MLEALLGSLFVISAVLVIGSAIAWCALYADGLLENDGTATDSRDKQQADRY